MKIGFSYKSRKRTKITVWLLTLSILLSSLMPNGMTWLFRWIEGPVVKAEETGASLGEPQVHTDEIPECDFRDELYDGVQRIGRLPSEVTYHNGHTAPRHMPLKDFRAMCGTGSSFNATKANEYRSEGCKLMLADAEDLYHYARVCNLKDGTLGAERSYYLSAEVVLGNNIEYAGQTKLRHELLPIGDAAHPFTGHFDGQQFELRDLHFASSEEYVNAHWGLFGAVGAGGVIENFGICHAYINCQIPTAYVGVAAGLNNGTIRDVYVIANEYKHEGNENTIITATVNATSGIVGRNASGGVLRDSYFAGMLYTLDDLGKANPVCAVNEGTVANCYFDSDVYQWGNYGYNEFYAKMMICALSYGKLYYSANYGNIEINNVVFQRDSVPVAAGAGGDHNINYGAVTVSDCVAGRRESSSYTPTLYLSGLSYSTPGEYLENRGRITADNTSYAVYNGTEYTNKGICISAGGITVFGKVVGCLNRGDILLNKVGYSSNVGGIRSYNNDSSSTSDNSTEKCVNYGNITLNECGIGMNVGGISGYDCKIKSCYNFGSICVSNPTTYMWSRGYYLGYSTSAHIGGLCGRLGAGAGINYYAAGKMFQSVNYGDILYENTNGDNTSATQGNTYFSFPCYIGGVSGTGDLLQNVMNYGKVTVTQEPNATVFAGGITGIAQRTMIKNAVNYGDITIPSRGIQYQHISYDRSSLRVGLYGGGISGFNSMEEELSNAVNYGQVKMTGPIESDRIHCGALIGGQHNMAHNITGLVDLTEYPDGAAPWPLVGGTEQNNSLGGINYTLYPEARAASDGFGTIRLVTLDKDNGVDSDADSEGLYYANFLFRKKLVHQISEGTMNSDNGLVYQDFDRLSPYLQAYMTKRFGPDICGAYVVVDDNTTYAVREENTRQQDSFIPNGSQTEGEFLFGCRTAMTDPVDLPITNTLYAENCPARTMATDFGYYAQQTAVSSMAELYRTGMQTVYCYENSGTREYQVFNDYMTSVETNPAMNSDYPPADEDKVEKKDGEVIANDHVLYTDIYCYFSIDDLNSASARQIPDGEEINPGKNIYLKLNPDKTLWSAKNSSLLVSTDTADYDVETAAGQDVDFSGVRLKSYTLEEALSDASKWTENTEQWSIAVPYDPDNPDATLKKTYTKVYGVLTAEDGVHRSIVRVNVVIDSFRQSAVLEAVKLRTVYNTSWYNEETNQ